MSGRKTPTKSRQKQGIREGWPTVRDWMLYYDREEIARLARHTTRVTTG